VILERAVAEYAWQPDDGLGRILLPLPWAVPFVNVCLVASRDEFVLIDVGGDWLPSLRALGRALKVIGVPSGGLTGLALTHQHSDHRGRWSAA
jgi:glyoxylase-like metal-dependent hydrolase (beta-lactamase superfamily II)